MEQYNVLCGVIFILVEVLYLQAFNVHNQIITQIL